MQRWGVLGFGYGTFPHFLAALNAGRVVTGNLGDNAQTIASRELLQRLGVAPDQIVRVDRDGLASYAGPPVRLLMNGVFSVGSYPLAPNIEPIYVGFSAPAHILSDLLPHLAPHAPIGCRDQATADGLKALGLEAYVTGCVTITLSPRLQRPTQTLVIVAGNGPGALPSGLLRYVPADLFEQVEIIHHRAPLHELPASERSQDIFEAMELGLFEKYCSARLVLTPLHHVAAPCLALGAPVVIARRDLDPRFTALSEVAPVYTPERFSEIDWNPEPVNVSPAADRYVEALKPWLNLPAGLSATDTSAAVEDQF